MTEAPPTAADGQDDLSYHKRLQGEGTPQESLKRQEEPKAEPDKKAEPGPVFTAEDVLVRPYGEMAALTFRLVEHDPDGKVSYFRNSGTFLLSHGKWQAITWQATRVAAQDK